jgi:small multidrug resistance pump
MSHHLYLTIAIICEVFATSFLKASDGFTKLTPSILVVIGYSCAFYCLSISLKHIPIGIAYAVWCGGGILLVALIGFLFFDQKLTIPALLGMGFIIMGVVVLQVFSGITEH